MNTPTRQEPSTVEYRRFEDTEEATAELNSIVPIYREVYREPPYLEDEADVQDFAGSWHRRTSQPGFRLVVAAVGGKPIGFGFGHRLVPKTRWWHGAVDELDVDTAEWSGRTFAIIELALLTEFRGQGIGRRLHDLLLRDAAEERVTLLVRPEPEAEPARRLYDHLGYWQVGEIVPFEGGPLYDALVREIRD